MASAASKRAGWRGFGVAGALPLQIVRELAPAAEAAGYHTFWVNDTPNGDGLTALRAAADATATIDLGVGVIPLDRQAADVIARRVDELGLPQDRLLIGIGSGSAPGGLTRVRTGAKVLSEALAARVIIGALGPKMCALAGEAADGVLLNWLTAEYVAPSAALVEDAAATAGRPNPLIYGYVRTAFGPGAFEAFVAEARRYASYPAYAANFARMGSPAEATGMTGNSRGEIQAELARFRHELDETVVRAVTGEESAAAYMALLKAAAP